MARDPNELRRLARELAALTPEERARVVSEAAEQAQFKPLPKGFKPPVLKLGGPWTGGSLRREELYGDDDR
jgi:hypothetical protein